MSECQTGVSVAEKNTLPAPHEPAGLTATNTLAPRPDNVWAPWLSTVTPLAKIVVETCELVGVPSAHGPTMASLSVTPNSEPSTMNRPVVNTFGTCSWRPFGPWTMADLMSGRSAPQVA